MPLGPRMWIRMDPPGRGSSSQTGLENPRGPNHCATCFGSVHASNTSSRGASRMRVMTSFRPEESSAELLPFSAMFLLLFFQRAQVIVQAIEALLPAIAIMFHPVGDILEGPGVEPAGPPLRLPPLRDQAG